MVPLDRLNEIVQRFEYIEAQMAAGGGDIAQLGREYAELRPVVAEIRAYSQVMQDIEGARALLDDPEMRELAQEELAGLEAQVPDMEERLQLALLPKDAADARPARGPCPPTIRCGVRVAGRDLHAVNIDAKHPCRDLG